MDETCFKTWLSVSGKSKKVHSDAISRLKALQRELGSSDLDEEYNNDACRKILSALNNKGENDIMRSYGNVNLPIGQYSLAAYRYALNLYVHFRDEQNHNHA